MTTLTVRLPARLKSKLVRLSQGRTGGWVCERIEKAREHNNEPGNTDPGSTGEKK